ncbi:MAG TPA: M1 family aminopeptidase [Vicinamibacterales bacterium]|nr:M1 family aminopeptidase [Vicinamibacterales bacterium]
MRDRHDQVAAVRGNNARIIPFERRSAPAILSVAIIVVTAAIARADTYPRQPGVDAIHYTFRLTIGDADNEISGEATATLKLHAGITEVFLDLTSAAAGKGMTVSAVRVDGRPARFTHQANRLRVELLRPSAAGDQAEVTVDYRGVPAQGLRIISNIHGERTAFSENWPNRARQWLPMIDHPYDKATGEFLVTAPAHYQVVANGLLVEELDMPGGLRRTHWKQSVPIASWLYAIGMARFAVHHYDVVRGIPQQVWVFPQDREKAYELFEFTGRRAFEFFSDRIGPYAYEKLGHVQAAGLGGGTEHASIIFYGEKGVASGRAPVVHEVAHQWWGNAVTENDWDDVWLSEGFATYFTHLYTEQYDGRDAFVRGLQNDVRIISQAQLKLPGQPVIHRNISDMSTVLNRLVYQKGGWVLHMLRGLAGTERFWSGVREYYRRYRNQNASTDDFRRVMERAAGTELSWFFEQWLERPGMPKLKGTWRYDATAQQIQIELAQVQAGPAFRIPIEIGIADAGGRPRLERIELVQATGRFVIAAEREPSAVVLDPNTWILMEAPDFGRTTGGQEIRR